MENAKHDALMRRPDGLAEKVVVPVADMFETSDEFVLRLDMPGATKEAIHLNIEPDRLSVHGTVMPHHQENANLLFNEISRKKYLREFNLGDGIDRETIKAQYDDGVLTILLPKTEAMKVRTIPIH